MRRPGSEEAAALLCRARLEGTLVGPLPVEVRPRDAREAYAVQATLERLLGEAGWGAVAGYKIGCTTPVMQGYMGIDHPCAGRVYGPTVSSSGATLEYGRYARPGVECEVAVRLGRDLPLEEGPFDRRSAAAAVGAAMAAIEIVDDRYDDRDTLGTPTLIADDFFGAGCVLGDELEDVDPLELGTVRATMCVNGKIVGSGEGSDALGHPLDALAWLANSMCERGESLRAGDIVLLGSLVQTHRVEPGDVVVVSNEPLGDVTARFLEAP